MLPILQVGPLAIQTPGLILLAGVWIGLSIAELHSAKRSIEPEAIYNLVFTMLVAGLLGARLAYAARFPNAFLENPISLISINPGLLDPAGGLAVAFISGLIYGQRKLMPVWATLDALMPVLAIMMIAIPLANLASGLAFGSETSLPWAIDLWGAPRHPVQLYSALTAAVILWLLWPRRQNNKLPSGWTFLSFIVLSAAGRILLEAFRGDSLTIIAGIRGAQIIAWFVLAAALWGMYHLRKQVES